MTISKSSNGYSLSVTNVTPCYTKSATDQARSLTTTPRRTSGPFRLRREIFINILQNYPIPFHSKWRTCHLPFWFFISSSEFRTSRSQHVTGLHVLRNTQHRRRNDFVSFQSFSCQFWSAAQLFHSQSFIASAIRSWRSEVLTVTIYRSYFFMSRS
jgi:hypothetical protein